MKNFEDILKEKLEHHEVPYQKGAWESFSAINGGVSSTPKKWYFIAGASIVALLATTFFVTNQSNDAVNVNSILDERAETTVEKVAENIETEFKNEVIKQKSTVSKRTMMRLHYPVLRLGNF